MTIESEVYPGASPGAPSSVLATLAQDKGRTFLDQLNDTGTLGLSMPKGGADAALCQTYRWLKIRLNGAIAFSGRIGPRSQTSISGEEEAGEDLNINGPGALATWRDAVVHPHAFMRNLAKETTERFFNFAASDYTDWLLWADAVELYRQDDPLSVYSNKAPKNWPDPTAFWIWGVAPDFGVPVGTPPSPVGDNYFRTQITLDNDGDYIFFITADDGYELWIDGVLITAQTEAFVWRETFSEARFLQSGLHDIAIRGVNIVRENIGGNVAAVIFAMYSTRSGGILNELVVHSDSTWKSLPYPPRAPGMTPGEIAVSLKSESDVRGPCTVWSLGFNGAQDSGGDLWAQELDISVRMGEPYLDVWRKMAETYTDMAVDHNLLRLLLWSKGGIDATPGVQLFEAESLLQLNHSLDPAFITNALVRISDGSYLNVSSGQAASPPSGDLPVIEGYLEAGSAGSPDAGNEMAQGLFDKHAASRVTVSLQVEPIAGKRPLVDFKVGDTITVPNMGGGGFPTQIVAISVSEPAPSEDGEELGTQLYAVQGIQ